MGLCTVYVIDWSTEAVIRVFHLFAHTPEEAVAKAKAQLAAETPPLPETPYHFHVQLLAELTPPGRVIVAGRMQ